MASKKITMLAMSGVTVIGVLLAVSTMGVLGAPRGSGKVQAINVGVYLDSSCTANCTSIEWGNIKPGGTVNQTVYVKNLGSGTVSLKLSTSNWNPASSESLMTLSWNVSNRYWLQVGKVVPVTLTLKAGLDTGNLSDFSFSMIITGIQK